MINNYTLLKDDPTYPLFQELRNRKKLSPIERADKCYELFILLHRTSSSQRPTLNGNSRSFMIKNLGISKSLLSQYLSTHKNISSLKVREEMKKTALAVRFSYLVSLVRGKNLSETEMLQLAKIQEFTKNRRITEYHKRRNVI
jgi:predicted transcriptional regulator